jgi:hypothetical protein
LCSESAMSIASPDLRLGGAVSKAAASA